MRDVLQIRDSRLTPAMVVIVFCLATDFFGRVALFSPASLRVNIEESTTLSDAVPQIDQQQVDSYMSNIAGLISVPTQVEAGSTDGDLAAQQSTSELADGYWRAGELSYKLIALVENSERFAVLYSLDNEAGGRELIELRLGDSIEGYTVSELLAKRLLLTSENGGQVTLALFETEGVQD